jgi:hypothetical protein
VYVFDQFRRWDRVFRGVVLAHRFEPFPR